jgi:hypothetical protein
MLAWSELDADFAPVVIAKSIDMAQQIQDTQRRSAQWFR